MFRNFKYSDREKEEILSSMKIIVDTREQKTEHITSYFDKANIDYIIKKLDYGDYSFYIPANESLSIPRDMYFDKEIIVERKASLEELSGNLVASDRARFEKELSLAPKNKVLLVENASYGDMLQGKYRTKLSNKAFWASLHKLWHEYNIPFIFMPETKYSGLFIRGYFEYYLKTLIR